jgi:hypothetical protein
MKLAVGIFILALILSCDFPGAPQVVTVSSPSPVRPSKPSDVNSPEAAMAAVMTVLRDDLDLPVVNPIRLFLYNNKASMAWHGRSWKTLPIDVEDFTAFADGNKIHIDLGGSLPNDWGSFIELLAHEYGHSIEAKLGARHRSGWFAEGFAGWVSAQALHSLGWVDYGRTLERAQFEVLHSRPLPSWDEVARDWKALLRAPDGYVKTYVLAFVAVDRLISKSGIKATVKYIENGRFEESFQWSWQNFQSNFAAYLSSLEQANHHDSIFQKPQWRVGDEWTYQFTPSGQEPDAVNRVVREDEVGGKSSYVVRAGDEELVFAKETLTRMDAPKQVKVTGKQDFLPQFSWPLSVGKRWLGTFEREKIATKKMTRITLVMVGAKIEEASVPAGVFRTIRIQGYESKTGRLVTEIWYAPVTKSIVKSVQYTDFPFRQKVLKSFRVEPDAK